MSAINAINGKEVDSFPVLFVVAYAGNGKWGFSAIQNSGRHWDSGFERLSRCHIDGFGGSRGLKGETKDPGPFDSPEEALQEAIKAVRNAGNEHLARVQEATRRNQEDIAAILGDGK